MLEILMKAANEAATVLLRYVIIAVVLAAGGAMLFFYAKNKVKQELIEAPAAAIEKAVDPIKELSGQLKVWINKQGKDQ